MCSGLVSCKKIFQLKLKPDASSQAAEAAKDLAKVFTALVKKGFTAEAQELEVWKARLDADGIGDTLEQAAHDLILQCREDGGQAMA